MDLILTLSDQLKQGHPGEENNWKFNVIILIHQSSLKTRLSNKLFLLLYGDGFVAYFSVLRVCVCIRDCMHMWKPEKDVSLSLSALQFWYSVSHWIWR